MASPLDRIERFGFRHAHRPATHVLALVLFVAVEGVGYLAWGLPFVQGWGGGIAACVATFFLVFKSQGYWAWMIVNAALWIALFFELRLPILAWLQVSFLVFAGYGLVQWTLVRSRIGVDLRVRSDILGSALALGVFVTSVYAYRSLDSYVGTTWWYLELGTVLLAVSAMWMDAFRYKLNWLAWTCSNALAVPLFWHVATTQDGASWGPFWTIFVYQAINIVGWFVWVRDEARVKGGAPARVPVHAA
jgi:nicotinamide riboside transporter PnuC